MTVGREWNLYIFLQSAKIRQLAASKLRPCKKSPLHCASSFWTSSRLSKVPCMTLNTLCSQLKGKTHCPCYWGKASWRGERGKSTQPYKTTINYKQPVLCNLIQLHPETIATYKCQALPCCDREESLLVGLNPSHFRRKAGQRTIT